MQERSIAFFKGWGNLQGELDGLGVVDVPEVQEAAGTLESPGASWTRFCRSWDLTSSAEYAILL